MSRHFILNFSDVRFSFEFDVNLQSQYSYVSLRCNALSFDFYAGCHVEFFEISDQVNQLVFGRREHDAMSTCSVRTLFVKTFQRCAVLLDSLFVDQDVDVVDKIKVTRVDA